MLTNTHLWNPFAELESFGRQVERAFAANDHASHGPAWNVYDGDDAVTLTAELPGYDPERFEIEVIDDRLTLAGGRTVARDEASRAVLTERGDASFSQTLRLGFTPEADAIDAEYRHGVLAVTVRKPEARQPKKIAVRV